MKDTWSPDQYLRFADERSQPFWDLAALLLKPDKIQNAVDLGCGTGELTAALAKHLQIPKFLGIDSSSAMLAKATTHSNATLQFEKQAIESFTPREAIDLLFSNAALQWIPDHEKLFPKLLGFLSRGGQFAVQMPYNHGQPSHYLAIDVAKRLFGTKVEHREYPLLPIERYAEILFSAGFRQQQIFLKVYTHSLASAEEIVEWTKGSLLTHYEKQLSPTEYENLVNQYRDELVAKVGKAKPYLYTFQRLLIWGLRA